MSLAVEVFHCLPDELMARVRATDGSGVAALKELLAYYHIKQEDRDAEAWRAAIDQHLGSGRRARAAPELGTPGQ